MLIHIGSQDIFRPRRKPNDRFGITSKPSELPHQCQKCCRITRVFFFVFIENTGKVWLPRLRQSYFEIYNVIQKVPPVESTCGEELYRRWNESKSGLTTAQKPRALSFSKVWLGSDPSVASNSFQVDLLMV